MSSDRTGKNWSREWELNPRPVDYEMSVFALSRLFSIDPLTPVSLSFAPFLRPFVQRLVQRFRPVVPLVSM